MRVSAPATSAAVQSRCVAQTIAAAAVTSGAANDVPSGVLAVSEVCETPSALDAMTRIPCIGATRSTCGPRVEPFQTCVEEPAFSPPTPSTPGSKAGNVFFAANPCVADRGNHQRAPELQRAQGIDERTRRTGRRRDVHDLRAVLPQPAECLHEAVLEHRLVAGGRSEDARREQRRVRRQPHDAHVGPVRDQDAGDGGAVPDRVVRHALAPGREVQQRRLTGREAIVVDARVGHADHHPRARSAC